MGAATRIQHVVCDVSCTSLSKGVVIVAPKSLSGDYCTAGEVFNAAETSSRSRVHRHKHCTQGQWLAAFPFDSSSRTSETKGEGDERDAQRRPKIGWPLGAMVRPADNDIDRECLVDVAGEC